MAKRTLIDKLAILADAAKYDASCASSGTETRSSLGSSGIGSTEGMGICHAYAPDGRCISLLKVLLTNFCIFDCRYCINRSSSNVERARFTPAELVKLTLDFYKRNYIEGLFLSSGIIRSPDYTMEQLVEVARALREDHGFRGYIHLKTIAEADPLLIEQAGLYADRLSVNIELPTETALNSFAPEKSGQTIRKAMADVRLRIDAQKEEETTKVFRKSNNAPRFAPAGQSTQMIIGADQSTDADIIGTSERLYSGYNMRRVYYSAYSPIPDASGDLPPVSPPLIREHRLYQADWLFRFYGFEPQEITESAGKNGGMLDLDMDPKLAWAVHNPGFFPINVNVADKQKMLRIPGLGPRNVSRLISIRRHQKVRLDDLTKLSISLPKIMPFIETIDHRPGRELESDNLRARFAPKPQQADLFG